MNTLQSQISSIKAYVPSQVVENEYFEEKFKMRPGTIEAKTGLKSRRYSEPDEHPTDMGMKAISKVLTETNCHPKDIDMIISASASKDQPIPTDAMQYAHLLNIELVQTFHVESVCLSFVQALEVADLYVRMGRKRKILIVSSEKCSKMVDPNDTNASIVLGDGAAAALIEPSKNDSHIKTGCLFTTAKGRNIQVASIKGGGTRFHPFDKKYVPEWAYFYINGGLQLKLSLRYFPPLLDDLFEKAMLSFEDLDYVIPHQVIPRLIRSITETMGFQLNKVYINDEYGNQASASIPIGFAELVEIGKIKRGDHVLLIGGAAGFSVGGMILKY